MSNRFRLAIGLLTAVAGIAGISATAAAQSYNSYQAGKAQGSFTFKINGTDVTSANYSTLTGTSGDYTFGFNGTNNPFTIVFGDGSYLDVYGVRAVSLLNSAGITSTLSGSTISGYTGATDAFTTNAWGTDTSAFKTGYAISNNGFSGASKSGANWLAYQASNDPAVDLSTKQWTGKAQSGVFTFGNVNSTSASGFYIGLDVFGDRYLSDGTLDTAWATAGGSGRVRLTDVTPDPGPGDPGPGSSIVPEGASLPMLLLGLAPVCGVFAMRLRRTR